MVELKVFEQKVFLTLVKIWVLILTHSMPAQEVINNLHDLLKNGQCVTVQQKCYFYICIKRSIGNYKTRQYYVCLMMFWTN